MMAAFVEGVLDDDACVAVEKHVANCSECTFVVAQTNRFVAPEREEVDASPEMDWRWLIAAAALAALVWPALLWKEWRDPLRRVKAVAADASVRTVEGRLDGFAHRPFSGPRSTRVPDATARLEAERLAEHEDFHARGVAMLVAGRVAEAVDALRTAAAKKPDDTERWSDLSAAEIALAASTHDPNALRAAMRSAERAITESPDNAAAHFNRAVAAESLGRTADAGDSYRRALALDARSAWAEEARSRLAATSR
jgi:tetratricopeptide (TPR) repeat protein